MTQQTASAFFVIGGYSELVQNLTAFVGDIAYNLRLEQTAGSIYGAVTSRSVKSGF